MSANIRLERLASSIQRQLQATIARGLNDPRIRGMVTVTRVEILDEGRIARAFISVLPEERAELAMHGLRDATGFLRRAVMSKIRVRLMPALEIRYDKQLQRQSDVLQAIARVEQERLAAEAESRPATGEHGTVPADSSDMADAAPVADAAMTQPASESVPGRGWPKAKPSAEQDR